MKPYFFYAQIARVIVDNKVTLDNKGNFIYNHQPTNKENIQHYEKMKQPSIEIYKDTLANKLHRTSESGDIKSLRLRRRGISDVLLPEKIK